MDKNYIPTTVSRVTINNVKIPWRAKVKFVAVGKYTDSNHIGKEGLLSRDMAPIYTMPNHSVKKANLMVVNNNGDILEKIQIYDDDTIEIIQENPIELWEIINENWNKNA
jgi:hypothetical protein